MKYSAIVDYIKEQPMYDEYMERATIPATDKQLEKLIQDNVIISKNFSVWFANDNKPRRMIKYKRA